MILLFSSYFRSARRSLWRDRSYSILNILGLSAGMTCALLIFVFIRDEMSYDRYHAGADHIYRVVDSIQMPKGPAMEMALSSAACAPRLKQEFPEVEETVRMLPRRRLVRMGDVKFYEDDLFYADPSIFRVFTLPMRLGNSDTALASPDTVVLSRQTALKYFGEANPLEKILQIEGQDFRVTGVMEDMPRNSHFRAELIVSLKTLERIPGFRQSYLESWARHEFYTYIRLRAGVDSAALNARLPGFIDRHAAEQIRNVLGGRLSSRLQPMTRIWLHSKLQQELRPNSDIRALYIFGLIGLTILVIACTNYINLATARSVSRTREVGLRKVLGARRLQLAGQFLGESLLLSFGAVFPTLVMTGAAIPAFNQLTGKGLDVFSLIESGFAIAALALFLLVGFAAGGYPALHVTRLHPASVLNGRSSPGMGGRSLRCFLVGLQFAVSLILIVSTLVVHEQIDFLRNRGLGFDKRHVAMVPVRSARMRRDYETVKAELSALPGIIGSSLTIGAPGGIAAGDSIKLLTEDGPRTMTFNMIYTDHDYLSVMGMEIVLGRDFSRDIATDASEAFIINESAVEALGLQDPLQARFEWGSPGDPFYKRGRVIGVVRNFAFRSLKEGMEAFIIHIHPGNTLTFAIRIQPSNIHRTLGSVEKIWERWDPAHPFEVSFLDENFDRLYRGEERMGRIFRILTALALGIAALGLFGLAMFTVRRRTREIGIRKVLGASVPGIFWMLLREFTRLVLLAALIAWPLAYWILRSWLNNFAFRTGIGIRAFLISAGLVMAVAFLAVSWQAFAAAGANPAKSLRCE